MNKQELIDKAVHALGGVFDGTLPKYNHEFDFWVTTSAEGVTTLRAVAAGFSMTKEEFQQRASELGYINGYRYGVEYPTNGKKPDLDDDIFVDVKCKSGSNEWQGWTDMTVADTAWTVKQNSIPATSFKIIDQRYKPADTSYLDKQAVETISLTSTEWYDYDNQKAIALPPVGEQCEWKGLNGGFWVECEVIDKYRESEMVVFNTGKYRNCRYEILDIKSAMFRPLDHNRKAEAEKKRVVEAAYTSYDNHTGSELERFYALYDAGYLKLPSTKEE